MSKIPKLTSRSDWRNTPEAQQRAQERRAKDAEAEARRHERHTQEIAKDNPFKETPLQELAEALRSIHAQVKRQAMRPDFAAALAGRYLDAAIEKGFMAGDLAFRGNHIESKLRSWNLALGNAIAYLRNEGKISEDVPKHIGYYGINCLPALADLIKRHAKAVKQPKGENNNSRDAMAEVPFKRSKLQQWIITTLEEDLETLQKKYDTERITLEILQKWYSNIFVKELPKSTFYRAARQLKEHKLLAGGKATGYYLRSPHTPP